TGAHHAPQLLALLVGQRRRAERELARAWCADLRAAERLLESLEEPSISLAGRTLLREHDAAGVAERVVVDGRFRVGNAIEENEPVIAADFRRLGATADRAGLERQDRSGRTRRVVGRVVGEDLGVAGENGRLRRLLRDGSRSTAAQQRTHL